MKRFNMGEESNDEWSDEDYEIANNYDLIDSWWDLCEESGGKVDFSGEYSKISLGEDFVVMKSHGDFVIMSEGCMLFKYVCYGKIGIEFGFDFTPEQFSIIHDVVIKQIDDDTQSMDTTSSINNMVMDINVPHVVNKLLEKYKKKAE